MAEEGIHAYDPLDTLLADQMLGPAAKLAFCVLWKLSECRPGRLCFTAAQLGARLGGSPRAAWDWLESLQKNDLIRIGERTRRGSIEVFVFHPCPGNREATPDPQLRLPLGHPNDAAGFNGALGDSRQTRPTPPADAEGWDEVGDFGESQSDDENPRGGLRAETPDRNNANSPGNTAHAGFDSGVCAPKPPTSSMYTKREDNLSSQNLKVIKESNGFNEGSGGRFTSEARAVVEMVRPRTAQSEAPSCVDSDFSAVQSAATIAMLNASQPAEQKARLMRRIQSAVGVPIAEWVAGQAANLVVYGEVPIRELEHILIDLDAKRHRLTNAAAWFHAQARKLAGRYGKHWPHRKNSEDLRDET